MWAIAPSAPHSTAWTSAGPGRLVMSTSASATQSATERAGRAPSWRAVRSAAGLRSNAETWWPAVQTLRHMWPPM